MCGMKFIIVMPVSRLLEISIHPTMEDLLVFMNSCQFLQTRHIHSAPLPLLWLYIYPLSVSGVVWIHDFQEPAR